MNGRRLYEEIGGVDDKYLQQAAYYHARKKSKSSPWRVLLVAAVLMLVSALVVVTVGASIAIGVIVDLLQNVPEVPDEPTQDQEQLSAVAKMELTMQTVQRTQTPLSAEKINFFNATPTLIFSEQGSEEYYTVRLTKEQCTKLIGTMQNNQRTEFSEQSPVPEYRIWLSFGDGVVVSPYLKNTPGNAGHGALFDYDPELEMNDVLAELITRCIEE